MRTHVALLTLIVVSLSSLPTVNGQEKSARKNVAIFIHEGVELLDFAGPGEVIAAADKGKAFNVYTVAASKDTVKSQRFLTVKP